MSAKWRPAFRHGLRGDLGTVAGVIAGAEECHNDRGWDQLPPMLYVLSRTPDSRPGYLDLSMTPVNEASDLARIAHLLETGTAEERAGFDPPGDPVAHVFLAEGYRAATGITLPPGCDPADVVGSIECRFAVGIVGEADVLYLRRDRGRQQEVLNTRTDAGPVDRLGGEHVYPGLLRVHTAARRLHGLAT
ncbi:hypothetical protein SAMN05421837_107398 [Amycolatopsis pretoriensis]|uniref:Uncharacterized protein n=1 Tax=Amycolatopsis pretoriensis TaxID=218821 RepID=A0A1H5R823_9PSEU|nr:hypothetical protein SAMN05421837_107398 [Amycolatopsis pretoriensis]